MMFRSDAEAAAFGLTVGVAGVLGDLAESLIKRDRGVKDASQTVPGFGGVLDVVDSVLFAAPVVYGWLTFGGARPF
jgi:phosphatidate cytidylyltransferase